MPPTTDRTAQPPPVTADVHRPGAAWAPLARADFRILWSAALVSNIGVAAHDLAAGWLMTRLDPSPIMVAMVPAAGVLPLLLFSLPAGALADMVDRRRVLLLASLARLMLALALAWLVWFDAVSPWSLLALTFALGTGAALTNPAWQTAMVELVPRSQLHAASALNSLSLNLSRAAGPAIGGLAVAWWGVPAAFALNAACFAVIAAALWRWRGSPVVARAGPLTLAAIHASMREGLLWARGSGELRAVLVRTAFFVLGASSLWALLPLLAREHLSLSADGYGVLLTCLGVGAVAGALLLPWLRRRLSPTALVAAATVLMAGSLAALAGGPLGEPSPGGTGLRAAIIVPLLGMFAAGWSWITVVTCVNAAAQLSAPDWVRARAFSCYLAVFFGTLAGGSWLWGMVAERAGLAPTLLAAGGWLLLTLLTFGRWRLGGSGA